MNKRISLILCPPSWTKTPPLGIAYLAEFLSAQGITVTVYDLNITLYHQLNYQPRQWLPLNGHFEHSLFHLVKSKSPHFFDTFLDQIADSQYIGFSILKRNMHFTLNLAHLIKHHYPDKIIIIGGPHTLFMKLHNETFSPLFIWVAGEGELPLARIIFDHQRSILTHPQELQNLDILPHPSFSQFRLSYYNRILPLVSSRGCIKQCAFCTERLLSHSFRQHSPLYIIDTIKKTLASYKITTFSFQDSMINANIQWLETFCKTLINQGIRIKWEAQLGIGEQLTSETIMLMKKSGCYSLFIGLESAADNVLQLMNKGYTIDQAYTLFSILHQCELHFEISLIVGYPGETAKDYQKTLHFIKTHKNIIPKIAQVNPYVNYFSPDYTVTPLAKNRSLKLISLLDTENIPYTKSFINNLVYNN